MSLESFTRKGGKIEEFVGNIKGKNYDDLEKLFDKELAGKLGYEKKPLGIGGEDKGYRYLLPNGKAIYLEKGWEILMILYIMEHM